MARKSIPTPHKGPTLAPEQAKAQLEEALRRGRKLLEEGSISKERYDVWKNNTFQIVTSAFGEWSGHATNFLGTQQFTPGPESIAYAEHERRKNLERKIKVLEAQIEGLPLIVVQPQDISGKVESLINRKVFIVHGHDGELKEATARLVSKLDLEPVILHEQSRKGRTIIENFSVHANEAGFAIVLLTADDVGSEGNLATHSPLQLRARQNVVFEMGFFFGSMGRGKVCAIHDPDVEIPSDLAGILYVPYDQPGKWRFDVAKEIREAGYDVDLNRL